MTEIAVTRAEREGVTVPAPYVSDGSDLYLIANDGNILLYVENVGITALAATVITTAEVAGQALADTDIEVGAGSAKWCGPFPPVLFNQPDDSVLIQPDAGLHIRATGV